MEEKTKDDSEIITRAIKEMEEEGTLYKADGKPNIPLLMEKTGLTRQRARSLAKKDFKNVPHGNIGKEREKALNAEESAVVDSLADSQSYSIYVTDQGGWKQISVSVEIRFCRQR